MTFSHLNPERVARALSLAGGGVRGVFTATVLSELERHIGTNLSERFDCFVGTSVGGIIALGLASGLSAQKIAAHIIQNVQHVFADPAHLNPWGIRTTRYRSDHLRECIRQILGDKCEMMIRDLKPNIVVPAVEAISNRVAYFSNVQRIGSTSCVNASLIDVALATSAAPTYFAPHRIGPMVYLDGGIASNNPDIEALRFLTAVLSRPPESCLILSVGTGDSVYLVSQDDNMNAGAIKWIRKYKLLDRIMSLQESNSSGFVVDFLGDRYLRIDTTFDTPIQLDTCNPLVVRQLQLRASKIVTERWEADSSTLAGFVR
jgi:patatin-like phospholipase/acyl hydrolase